MVGYNAPPPVTKEQKAEQDRQIEAACDEVDKNYGPLIESARKAGDKAQIKKLADKARMKREDLIMEILYPEVKKFHAERDKQGEVRP